MTNFSDWSKNPETDSERISWSKKSRNRDRFSTPEKEQPPKNAGEIVAHSLEHHADDIAVAAYYRAEKRGFEPGHDVEDWLEAEAELKQTDG